MNHKWHYDPWVSVWTVTENKGFEFEMTYDPWVYIWMTSQNNGCELEMTYEFTFE